MRLDRPIAFHNRAGQAARYLVAVTADPMAARGDNDHGGSVP
jgi:hypothetical protein